MHEKRFERNKQSFLNRGFKNNKVNIAAILEFNGGWSVVCWNKV